VGASVALLTVCLATAAAANAAGIDSSYGENGIVPIAPTLPSGIYPEAGNFAGKAAVAPSGLTYYAIPVSRCRERLEASTCGAEAIAVVKYLPGGGQAKGFGTGGALVLEGGSYSATIAVDRQGRLLTVSGFHGQGGAVVRRYRGSGAIERSFGTDGQVTVPTIEYAGLLEIDSAGRILVGTSSFGEEGGPRGQELALARLFPDGRLDRGFGKNGSVSLQLPGSPGPIVTGPTGAIYVGGTFCCSGFTPLSRITSSGRLDTRFNSRARAAQARLLRGFEQPETRAIVPRANGEVDLLGGTDHLSSTGKESPGFALRLHRDGSVDKSYGDGGLERLPQLIAAAVTGRGGATLALSETTPPEGAGQVVALRLGADGTPDPRFGGPAGLAFAEGGRGSALTALAGGGALAAISGFRSCRESCVTTPYLSRLVEPAPPRTGVKHGGER
jgi:hypothetical protein